VNVPIIEFDGVGKTYALALHRGGGIKNLILNPPRALREMRADSRVVLDDFSLQVARGRVRRLDYVDADDMRALH
jgi:hypothetical protein